MSKYTKSLFVYIFAVIMFLSLTYCVKAHSWYDPMCCGGQDCDVATITQKGTETWATNKFGTGLVYDNYTRFLESKDNNTHACIVGNPEGGTSIVRCIYFPPGL